jgi:hypothetical protein
MSASAVIHLTETSLTDRLRKQLLTLQRRHTPGYLDFPWVDPGEIRPQGNWWICDFPWGIGSGVCYLLIVGGCISCPFFEIAWFES